MLTTHLLAVVFLVSVEDVFGCYGFFSSSSSSSRSDLISISERLQETLRYVDDLEGALEEVKRKCSLSEKKLEEYSSLSEKKLEEYRDLMSKEKNKQRRRLSKIDFGRSYGFYGQDGQSIFGKSRSSNDYYIRPFEGISGSESLSLRSGTGFIGGAVAGVAAISLYHHYLQYKSLLSCDKSPTCSINYIEENDVGLRILLNDSNCVGGCPDQAYCDYEICRCEEGYEARYGSCFKTIEDFQERQKEWDYRLSSSFDPSFLSPYGCSAHSHCQHRDINMVCKYQKCACRDNTQWNPEAHECQVYVDVNCTALHVESSVGHVSTNLMVYETEAGLKDSHDSATNLMEADEENSTNEVFLTDDEKNVTSLTADVTLANSELTRITLNTDIQAAFCRELVKTVNWYSPPLDEGTKSKSSNS